MERNRFDWILLLIFLVNAIFSTITGNYVATAGWVCAFMTLIRVLVNNTPDTE